MFSHEDFLLGQKWLVNDEGLRQKPYLDTKGIQTVMCGINLNWGFTVDECIVVLQMRMLRLEAELSNKLPFFQKLSPRRRLALINMSYQMGVTGLLKFTNLLAALKASDFSTASREALNSKWADEFKIRSKIIAKVIETDEISLEDFSDVDIPCLTIAIDSHGS